MHDSLFSKIFNSFSILYCLLLTVFALITILVPFDYYGLPTNTSKGTYLMLTVQIIIALIIFTAQPISLLGFYLSNGIGKKLISRIFAGILLFSLLATFLIGVYAIYLHSNSHPVDNSFNATLIVLNKLVIPIFTVTSFNLLIFPIGSTIMALSAKKVRLWHRFLPVSALVLSFVIAIALSAIIAGVILSTKNQFLISGMKGATIPQWYMLGSIAWVILALPEFLKEKEDKKNAESLPPSPDFYIQTDGN